MYINDFPYIMILLYITAGFLCGLFIEKIILNRLKSTALKTNWRGDEFIIQSFKGLVVAGGVIIGGYLALYNFPVTAQKFQSGKILFSSIVFLLTILSARLVVGMIKAKTRRTTGLAQTGSIIANITRVSVYIIGSLVILQTLGVSITPLLTALGVGGLAVALALQDTLSNLFSGIQIIASRQVKTGDYIKLDSGEEGYVADITWRNTTIRMLSNNLIVVPNKKIASVILTNYYLPDKETAVLVEVGVSYDSDLDKVERVTMDVASDVIKSVTGGAPDFDPFIRYHTFAESGINFSVILRAREFTDQYLIKHEFIKELCKRYKEDSIEIPFPIRTVIMKNQNFTY